MQIYGKTTLGVQFWSLHFKKLITELEKGQKRANQMIKELCKEGVFLALQRQLIAEKLRIYKLCMRQKW